MNISLDGYLAGPRCELDWHFNCWNEEMARTTSEQLGKADTILFGRVTYDAMAGYWGSKTAELNAPREDIDFADMMNRYTKIVFSKTLTIPHWQNSRVVAGDLVKEIGRLKKMPGKNMITYGSGKMVSSLLRQQLVDELQVWVHPVLLGCGKPLFREVVNTMDMELLGTKTFSTGVVLLHYDCLQ